MTAEEKAAGTLVTSKAASKTTSHDDFNEKAQPSQQALVEAARDYLERGWMPTPLQGKTPCGGEGWLGKTWHSDDELEVAFEQPKVTGVGCVLGAASGGLVDIDIDCEEGLRLAPAFFGKFNTLIFGRKSRPCSHYLFRVKDDMRRKPYAYKNGGMVVEMRGSGGQTMFPGSMHPDGEQVEWQSDEGAVLYEIEASVLESRVRYLAAACLLLRHWELGIKDDLATAVCGAMIRAGNNASSVDHFIRIISTAAGDQNTAKKLKAVELESAFLNNSGHVPGITRLRELLGEAAANALVEWLKLRGESDVWPTPTPLPEALPPVAAFTGDLLPEALRPWVMDIAHRMQCPADFPAVASLVGVASLIGARAVMQPKANDDWRVPPNLWGAVVGRPGVKKSPALLEVMKPLHQLQMKEVERWQEEHISWELDCKVAAMQAEGNEKKAKGMASKDPKAARALLEPVETPDEPVARRLIVNDATVEKLGELLQQNPWGTLSYRDELYGLLTGLDKQGQEGARAFMLQSNDGNQGYTFDRIGRGTVHIPRVCLAMLGGIQPGRIQEYVRGAVSGGSADDGLLQRFGLTVWPDITAEYVHVDQWPDTPAKQTAWAVFERLAALQPASDTEPTVWRFDDEAQALFVEWLIRLETVLRGDDLHPAMISHLSKYRKLIPALALVFALIDTPNSGGVIHAPELRRALAWDVFLRPHAVRLYAAAVMPETTGAVVLLSKIRSGKLMDRDGVILDSFTPRQVAVKGWAGLGSPDAVRNAADVLADYDWLRREVVQSGDSMGRGRPSARYIINPACLRGSEQGEK